MNSRVFALVAEWGQSLVLSRLSAANRALWGMVDPIDAAVISGAVAALRRRAARQLDIAAGDPGTGEAAIACRVGVVLVDLANELDWFGLAGPKVVAGS